MAKCVQAYFARDGIEFTAEWLALLKSCESKAIQDLESFLFNGIGHGGRKAYLLDFTSLAVGSRLLLQ
jgi:hypothetical protein